MTKDTLPTDDGGPAFPVEVDPEQPTGRQLSHRTFQALGLSMRDYFAAAALPSCQSIYHQMGQAEIAGRAYELADHMLKARAQ